MMIEDEFVVDVPLDEAWDVLLDVERIAPCMPGAQLQEIEGDEYRGIVKVKVGPITAQYKGAARITDTDVANRRVVLHAEGRDTRGQGTAAATVTALLAADGDAATRVRLETDLHVTGKVAQFGRGVMADVSAKLLGQFAQNLERDVLTPAKSAVDTGASTAEETAPPSGSATSAAPAPPEPAAPSDSGSAVRRVDHPEPQPVDLFEQAGGAVAKRLVPIVAAILVLLVLRSVRRRRRRGED